MAFCKNCGAPINSNAKFCEYCGSEIERKDETFKVFTDEFKEKVKDFCQKPEYTSEEQDISVNKVFAILAYFGLLVLVPIFAAKNSPYARFHANQGLVLLIFCVAYAIAISIITMILAFISPLLAFIGTLLNLAEIFFFVLFILGIVNAATGKTKELPIIGKIRILK